MTESCEECCAFMDEFTIGSREVPKEDTDATIHGDAQEPGDHDEGPLRVKFIGWFELSDNDLMMPPRNADHGDAVLLGDLPPWRKIPSIAQVTGSTEEVFRAMMTSPELRELTNVPDGFWSNGIRNVIGALRSRHGLEVCFGRILSTIFRAALDRHRLHDKAENDCLVLTHFAALCHYLHTAQCALNKDNDGRQLAGLMSTYMHKQLLDIAKRLQLKPIYQPISIDFVYSVCDHLHQKKSFGALNRTC